MSIYPDLVTSIMPDNQGKSLLSRPPEHMSALSSFHSGSPAALYTVVCMIGVSLQLCYIP